MRDRRTRRGFIKSGAPLVRRRIAIGLAALLVVQCGGSLPALAQQQQQTTPSQPVGGMPPPPEPSQNPETTTGQPVTGASPSGGPSSSTPQAPQQNGTQAPVGTAAAPYEKGIGVAASRPAGAVIAPAKQRRTRSFWIKTGVLIGAAVAVGTVVGLSSASPSRPQ